MSPFLVVLLLSHLEASPGAQDEEALRRGEVVIHRRPQEGGEGKTSFVASLEVDAPSDRVWAAMLDFEALGYRSSLTREVTRYRQEVQPDGTVLYGIRYRISVLGVDIVYHVLHRHDPVGGWLTWSLDPQLASDLSVVDGRFEVSPTERPGRVRLTYESRIDLGRRIPGTLERYLQEKQLPGHLMAIRDLAVAP